MASTVTEAPEAAPVKPKTRQALLAAAIALVVCLAAILGFIGGEHRQPGVTMLSGVAHVGLDEATISVNGYSYGIDGAGSVMWVDDQGTTHRGDWPSCLRPVGGSVPVKFAAVPVTVDGQSWRPVVWVDCRQSAAS